MGMEREGEGGELSGNACGCGAYAEAREEEAIRLFSSGWRWWLTYNKRSCDYFWNWAKAFSWGESDDTNGSSRGHVMASGPIKATAPAATNQQAVFMTRDNLSHHQFSFVWCGHVGCRFFFGARWVFYGTRWDLFWILEGPTVLCGFFGALYRDSRKILTGGGASFGWCNRILSE